jgi:hypothetical protein
MNCNNAWCIYIYICLRVCLCNVYMHIGTYLELDLTRFPIGPLCFCNLYSADLANWRHGIATERNVHDPVCFTSSHVWNPFLDVLVMSWPCVYFFSVCMCRSIICGGSTHQLPGHYGRHFRRRGLWVYHVFSHHGLSWVKECQWPGIQGTLHLQHQQQTQHLGWKGLVWQMGEFLKGCKCNWNRWLGLKGR